MTLLCLLGYPSAPLTFQPPFATHHHTHTTRVQLAVKRPSSPLSPSATLEARASVAGVSSARVHRAIHTPQYDIIMYALYNGICAAPFHCSPPPASTPACPFRRHLLRFAFSRSFGSAFTNPDRGVACGNAPAPAPAVPNFLIAAGSEFRSTPLVHDSTSPWPLQQQRPHPNVQCLQSAPAGAPWAVFVPAPVSTHSWRSLSVSSLQQHLMQPSLHAVHWEGAGSGRRSRVEGGRGRGGGGARELRRVEEWKGEEWRGAG